MRICGVLLAAALAVSSSSAFADEELKIGGIGSLSGGGTSWGLTVLRGTELAIDDLASEGGLVLGGVKYDPKLIMLDDAYSGQGAKTAAERLIYQEKVQFIIGSVGSPTTLAISTAINEARESGGPIVLDLGMGAAAEILKNKYGAPFNYIVSNTNREYAPPIVRYYKENFPEVKTVGILAPNDSVGQVVVPVLVDQYKQNGIDVNTQLFERGTKEFTPLITSMMAAGIDALDLNNNSPGDTALIIKQARLFGFEGHIFQTGGPGITEIIEAIGPLANGLISYDIYDFKAESSQPFIKKYADKYGSAPMPAFTPLMYNAAKLLFAAMRKADSVDPVKVRDALDGMSGYDPGVVGPVTLVGKETYGVSHLLGHDFLLSEVVDGKLQTRTHIKLQP